jgi:methyltransferase (TIGR00027 family)
LRSFPPKTAVRDGLPSVTAARVAAYRLALERLPFPSGDPAADERLTADVAAGVGDFEPSERMGRYLAARTRFFDRVVVGAIERGVAQLVVVGAGYDGRSLRYARPGVRWIEVDHPDTQADKRARLRRLGIDAAHVAFVGFDLREQGLTEALVAAGLHPDAPAQLLCEGVAVYLESAVLETMLTELRALAAPGTRLAMSSFTALPTAEAGVRERFAAAVGAVGEPVRSSLDADAVTRLLNQARWREVEVPERSARAGFVIAAPGPYQPLRPTPQYE